MATAAASRAPAPPIRAGWALFDPYVVTEDVVAAANGDNSTAACCATSGGREVRVSLRLADPPAVSYVEMRTDAELHLHGTPSVVAADGDLLLIDMACTTSLDVEHNFLVYKAHPSSPSLRLLPRRDDHSYAYYTGDEEEEEFVAAAFKTELSCEGGEEVGRLKRFTSSTGKHEELELPIAKGLHRLVWHTDKVFAFRGLMCFVDYHRGILLCDVFAAAGGGEGGGGSPELRFLPLPAEIEVWDEEHDYSHGRRHPEEHRTVDVSGGGVMRFVDVSDGLFGRRRDHPFAVTVTTWTLRAEMMEWEWEKDGVLQVGDLWSSGEFRRSPLPRGRAPLYPAVCKRDPGVVGFALMDPKMPTKDAWVITVDVRGMELLAYAPYTNQAKEGEVYEEGYEVVAGCLFYDTPFVGSDLGWTPAVTED
ncbi:unnamed protein product [Urochloa humidicola]